MAECLTRAVARMIGPPGSGADMLRELGGKRLLTVFYRSVSLLPASLRTIKGLGKNDFWGREEPPQ